MKDWISIFFDYYSGMRQREIERKYDVPMRTITWRCKIIMNKLFKDQESIINKQKELLKRDLEVIIIGKNTNTE